MIRPTTMKKETLWAQWSEDQNNENNLKKRTKLNMQE